MKNFLLIVSLLFFLSSTPAHSQFEYPGSGIVRSDSSTYVSTTASEYNVSWEPVTGATEYELEIYSVNRKSYVAKGTTANTNLTFKLPFQGLFLIKIRAVATVQEGEKKYSDWAYSDNPEYAIVDTQPKGWWIYSFIAPPGAIQ